MLYARSKRRQSAAREDPGLRVSSAGDHVGGLASGSCAAGARPRPCTSSERADSAAMRLAAVVGSPDELYPVRARKRTRQTGSAGRDAPAPIRRMQTRSATSSSSRARIHSPSAHDEAPLEAGNAWRGAPPVSRHKYRLLQAALDRVERDRLRARARDSEGLSSSPRIGWPSSNRPRYPREFLVNAALTASEGKRGGGGPPSARRAQIHYLKRILRHGEAALTAIQVDRRDEGTALERATKRLSGESKQPAKDVGGGGRPHRPRLFPAVTGLKDAGAYGTDVSLSRRLSTGRLPGPGWRRRTRRPGGRLTDPVGRRAWLSRRATLELGRRAPSPRVPHSIRRVVKAASATCAS